MRLNGSDFAFLSPLPLLTEHFHGVCERYGTPEQEKRKARGQFLSKEIDFSKLVADTDTYVYRMNHNASPFTYGYLPSLDESWRP